MDKRLADQARVAADQITARQHDLDTARDMFVRAVRTLYLGGGSLREIAEVLGLSHQRVHQLLGLPRQPENGRPLRRRGRARSISCSFCRREQKQVRKLITGQDGAGICNDCTVLATRVATHQAPATDPRATLSPAGGAGRCSFCGKRSGDGAHPVTLVSADDQERAVCTECLDLCHEILAEQPA